MAVTDWTTGVSAIALDAHKDRHDPEDGADPLDTAAPSELASVQAAGVGTSHSLARADHAHQIQHSIADNHLVTIDGTTNSPANLDYTKWTASGLEGKTYQELVNDISGVIKGTDVEVGELSTATYDDVQDYINFFGDRTILSGGAISDNGDGTATVALGKAWAKETDSDTAVGKFFDFSADASVALTDLTTNYVYLDYNAGTPQIVVSTDILTHGFKQDHIHVATIYRDGTTLHSHQEDMLGIGRVNIVDMYHLEKGDAERASGLLTTDSGSLAIAITTGVIYEGLSRHTTTVNGSTWSYWYYDGNLGTPAWVEVASSTTIDNTQYNDVATGLATLTANRYGVHWVYVDLDGADLQVVYGQGDYTAAQAEAASVPTSLPNIVTNYGVLIAKIIVQKSTTALTIEYPWTTQFTSSLATDHGSLAGLSDDDHAQYIKDAEFTQDSGILVGTGSGTFQEETGATLRTSIGLGNVENTAHSTDAHTMTIDGVDVSALDAAVVKKADFNAQTILAATTDDTPAALTVTEQTLVGRITSGNIAALSTTQIRTLINVTDGADVTGDNAPQAHDLGGASHGADTLSNLNDKVSDATLLSQAQVIAFVVALGG